MSDATAGGAMSDAGGGAGASEAGAPGNGSAVSDDSDASHRPGGSTHYYWRQLKDMKASAEIAALGAGELGRYVDTCAWCLARAHARSGDPVAIAAYLGGGESFDKAMAAFAAAYADQTERDWQALRAAIKDGRLAAVTGV